MDGRRHPRTVGRRGLVVVRARGHVADARLLYPRGHTNGVDCIRLQGVLQCDLHGAIPKSLRVDISAPLRTQSGSDRSDGRQSSHGLPVARDATLPVPRQWVAASGVYRGLAVTHPLCGATESGHNAAVPPICEIVVSERESRCRRRAYSWWQPWTALGLFAFLLHFVWEMLQVPAYRGMSDARHWDAVKLCLRATLGDVGLTLLAYGATAAASRRRWWLDSMTATTLGGFVAIGLVLTILLEALNVYALHRWAYALGSQMILGVGITPLVQWVVLPPLTLWLAWRHLGGCQRDHSV